MAKALQKMVGMGQRLGTTVVTQGPKVAGDAMQWSKPRLSKFWYYARVELTPPSPADIPAIQKGFSNIVASARTGKWKQLTTKEAWLNTLVCVEVAFWFFIGEQIGRRSIIGYNVKSDFEEPVYI
ncbi:ATP synthase subunit g, mitochondrial-like [Asterias rubens]|uniref:ATP synthase subunit g, mitochondrial-like n=1 Tax=Asterias rubens TaxID=7604 RepID=UPI00145596D4|nr:ATP synthase subunit g, mitochondrial-like [Asterias rubens]